jgi:HSP20 family protein
MRPNDPFDDDDPFDDIFRDLERMMDEMLGATAHGSPFTTAQRSGLGSPTDAHIDIHETENEIRVAADIPGVEKEAISLQCDGSRLRIEATGDQREYDEHVRLPTRVDPNSAEATYNNGILEVKFDQANGTAEIDLS